ncbi:MAG: DUF2971 domain-containing protein [Ignavibacteria bacterium]|nr:DUF2971 domain-containing protein [Ignavibacteria bacterium]
MINKFFKYCALNTFTSDAILNNYIVFNSPLNFNDPFDCQLYINCDNSSKKPFNIVKDSIENSFQKDNIEFKDFLINKLNLSYENFSRLYFLKIIHNLIKNLRISCFSEINNDTQMWAHYANKHTGMCIEFDFTGEKTSALQHFSQVIYKDLPIMELPEDIQSEESTVIDVMNKLILTKSKEWEHEKEWRIVLTKDLLSTIDDSKSKLIFDSRIISSIYFGCNVNLTERNLLIEKLHKAGKNYSFYQFYKNKFNRFEYNKIAPELI